MKSIEREIKILSHVSEIEFILDELGVLSKMETQHVLSMRIGQESHKLKIKKTLDNQTVYLFSKKQPVKIKEDTFNSNFSSKLEEEVIMTEEEFKVSEKLFRLLFENQKMMDYVIEKKRYDSFKGYKIDICKVIQVNDKSDYYTERFIEVETDSQYNEEKISLEQLLELLIPNESNIIAINCGMRNLNRFYKRTSIFKARK